MAVRGLDVPVAICPEHGFDRRQISVYDVMLFAMRVPVLYGAGTVQAPYSDANFAPGFRQMRRALIFEASVSSLVMSMWNQQGTQTIFFTLN